ncbi:hypothetical protein [Eubacterium sp. AF34-35BH]|nr:hypothetical protein [Eubacterium sp. AF34-35BH]RHP22317.1 hypothetical protein DWZ69_04900 [Eubacterium sp. AF34-35BH]
MEIILNIICVLQFVLFAMLSCAEIYLLKTKLKKEKRIKQGEKQERKIINNKTIGKIAYFSKKNVKSVEIK